MFISITPMGKPRMTQRDRWAGREVVQRYHAFCDELRLKHPQPLSAVIEELTFFVLMPKSWSNKKRLAMLGAPHQQKPDLDNLLKAVMDALCKDDSHVHQIKNLSKVWSEEPGIEIVEIMV